MRQEDRHLQGRVKVLGPFEVTTLRFDDGTCSILAAPDLVLRCETERGKEGTLDQCGRVARRVGWQFQYPHRGQLLPNVIALSRTVVKEEDVVQSDIQAVRDVLYHLRLWKPAKLHRRKVLFPQDHAGLLADGAQ